MSAHCYVTSTNVSAAWLEAAGANNRAGWGISVTAMTALRLAAEHPERVTHLIIAGGFAETLRQDPKVAERVRAEGELLRTNWPEYLHRFFLSVFTEPHSTKPFEDGVRYGWATTAPVMDRARNGWGGCDVRDLARRVRCPTLVIHGDGDKRVRSEEHTSELQSQSNLVCRLLLEKKKNNQTQ